MKPVRLIRVKQQIKDVIAFFFGQLRELIPSPFIEAPPQTFFAICW